jgi:hypothetical protein
MKTSMSHTNNDYFDEDGLAKGFSGSAAPLPSRVDPFALFMSPDTALAAVARLEKLGRLNRRVCHPMDQFNHAVDVHNSKMATFLLPMQQADMPEILYDELISRVKALFVDKGIRGAVFDHLKPVLKSRNSNLWAGYDIKTANKTDCKIPPAALQDFIQFVEKFPNENEFVTQGDQNLPEKLGLSATVVDQLLFVPPLIAQASIAEMDPQGQRAVKSYFRNYSGRYGRLWGENPNSDFRLPRRLVAVAIEQGLKNRPVGQRLSFG